MLGLNVGKGHQVVSFMVGTATALVGCLMLAILCYNRGSAHRVCALESSSY